MCFHYYWYSIIQQIFTVVFQAWKSWQKPFRVAFSTWWNFFQLFFQQGDRGLISWLKVNLQFTCVMKPELIRILINLYQKMNWNRSEFWSGCIKKWSEFWSGCIKKWSESWSGCIRKWIETDQNFGKVVSKSDQNFGQFDKKKQNWQGCQFLYVKTFGQKLKINRNGVNQPIYAFLFFRAILTPWSI